MDMAMVDDGRLQGLIGKDNHSNIDKFIRELFRNKDVV